MLAVITKTPELELTQQEADSLGLAISKVAQHYDLSANQKAIDWAHLCMALAFVYGPRFVVISKRKKTPEAGNVPTPYAA